MKDVEIVVQIAIGNVETLLCCDYEAVLSMQDMSGDKRRWMETQFLKMGEKKRNCWLENYHTVPVMCQNIKVYLWKIERWCSYAKKARRNMWKAMKRFGSGPESFGCVECASYRYSNNWMLQEMAVEFAVLLHLISREKEQDMFHCKRADKRQEHPQSAFYCSGFQTFNGLPWIRISDVYGKSWMKYNCTMSGTMWNIETGLWGTDRSSFWTLWKVPIVSCS